MFKIFSKLLHDATNHRIYNHRITEVGRDLQVHQVHLWNIKFKYEMQEWRLRSENSYRASNNLGNKQAKVGENTPKEKCDSRSSQQACRGRLNQTADVTSPPCLWYHIWVCTNASTTRFTHQEPEALCQWPLGKPLFSTSFQTLISSRLRSINQTTSSQFHMFTSD